MCGEDVQLERVIAAKHIPLRIDIKYLVFSVKFESFVVDNFYSSAV